MDPDRWHQHNVTFTDRESAKRAITERLGPALLAAEEAGQLDGWWFMNKQPWPLRYRAAQPSPLVQSALSGLVDDGTVKSWLPGIYEPEFTAFGGALSMDAAHDLFHEDSRNLLTYQPDPGHLGRRETAVLLISAMMRAASLDWFEQGDVWAKAAALRPATGALTPERTATLIPAMRTLMTVDAHSLCRPSGPLDGRAEWVAAYERAGTTLAHLATEGRLSRGLRAVIAHHVIFHANRAGLLPEDQSALFSTAREAVMGSSDNTAASTEGTPKTTSVGAVTTDTIA
ncbi:thiopeptide-type bacteriocin biosynthesis protein, partial [Streptomyces sp. NPDC051976]|uniref:thiopeptide-type bacteriocin biosynthesis protein n=1 Tax=Streptomyces sp. NPDC051976 TaxID=3154947 RepID=UPI003427BAD2